MRASATVEAAGLRSVSVIQTGFVGQARFVAETLGRPELPIVEYPSVIHSQEASEVDATARRLAGDVAQALLAPRPPGGGRQASHAATVSLTGSATQVNDYFAERGWSDGLPILPPTVDAVEAFLSQTDLAADHGLGEVISSNRLADVLSVAVNGVMAGCRPEYMPVLIAIAQAMTDPHFHLEHAGSTSGWEPLVVMGGPLVRRLELDVGGAAGDRQLHVRIGRFTKLFVRNLGEFRPGQHDKAIFRSNFVNVLTEDEETLAELAWQPFRVDLGFTPEEDVVTTQATIAASASFATRGGSAEEQADIILDSVVLPVLSRWSWIGWFWGEMYPLIVLSPDLARAFAADGWTKGDLRSYIADRTRITARAVEDAAAISANSFTVEGLVEEGLLPADYAASSARERLLRAFPWPDDIGIVVSGDRGRTRVMGYAQHGRQGARTSKTVAMVARAASGSRPVRLRRPG